jgi:molybdenum cofactor guanylyltransferase
MQEQAFCITIMFLGVLYMSKFSNDSAIIILAGGQSKRMGAPKSNLPIGEETILQHMLRSLRPLLDTVVVVCASQDKHPADVEEVIWAYDSVGGQGPLHGLQAGLIALPPQVTQTFVSSCDAPLMRPELVSWLLDDFVVGQALVPQISGFPQPLAAVYATSILSIVTEMLENGQRSLRALLNRVDTRWVSENSVRKIDPQLLSFENINTPEDYQRVIDLFESLSIDVKTQM